MSAPSEGRGWLQEALQRVPDDPAHSAQAEARLEAGDPADDVEARLEARIHEKAGRRRGRRWAGFWKRVFLGGHR